jgi:hypothetical protein
VSTLELEPEPGAAIFPEEENCPVMPDGSPDTERSIAAVKVEFAVVVNVSVFEPPAATVTEVAEDDKVKVGAGATASGTETVFFSVPLVPVTVAPRSQTRMKKCGRPTSRFFGEKWEIFVAATNPKCWTFRLQSRIRLTRLIGSGDEHLRDCPAVPVTPVTP